MVFNPLAPTQLTHAVANVYDAFAQGGLADTRPKARRILTEARHRTLYRYLPTVEQNPDRLPVLLVPTLGAPPSCFDLRAGNSMVEHLLGTGVPTYLVDFGQQRFSDRDLAISRWVGTVLPRTIGEVSADAGDRPVHLVGWSLGGVLAGLAAAADRELPVHTVSVIAAPFDMHRMRLRATITPLSSLSVLSDAYLQAALSGALTNPVVAPIVRRALRLASIPRGLQHPLTVLAHLHDRSALAQIEATHAIKRDMQTYTGRSIAEIYRRFIAVNSLDERPAELDGEVLTISDLTQPFLAIAGADDVLAPEIGVHAVGDLLPNSAEVRLRTAPGGHLAVLAGPDARRTTWAEIDNFQSYWDTRRLRRRVAGRRVSFETAGENYEPELKVV